MSDHPPQSEEDGALAGPVVSRDEQRSVKQAGAAKRGSVIRDATVQLCGRGGGGGQTMAEQNDERTKLTGALLGLLTVRMRLHCCSERNGWRSFCIRHLRITVSGSGSGSAAAKRKMLRTTLL